MVILRIRHPPRSNMYMCCSAGTAGLQGKGYCPEDKEQASGGGGGGGGGDNQGGASKL